MNYRLATVLWGFSICIFCNNCLTGCATRQTSIPAQRGDAERLRGSLRGAGESVTETAKASGTIEQEAEKLIQFLKQ